MTVFDRYLFRHIVIATVLTAATLTAIIFLAQSLQFLELIINAGASIATFWLLTFLAIPRFFEIILPVALMAATVFVYNRMTVDSELLVMSALGTPPLRLARPALIMAVVVTMVLSVTSLWIVPETEMDMDQTRAAVKSQYSTLMFHEGIFNPVRPGLTVFIRDRLPGGELRGIVMHDTRKRDNPITVVAKRGEVVATPEGQKVQVYDGTRQDINPDNRSLNRLDFKRYTIDLPTESAPEAARWREPSQRSFTELLHPALSDPRDRDPLSQRAFLIEANRRLISPLLAPAYTVLALAFLLLGRFDRRGQSWRIIFAIASVVAIQGFYMASFNLARQTNWGLAMMYGFVLLPLIGGLFILGRGGESLRIRLAAAVGPNRGAA